MKICDIMTRDVTTLREDMPVPDAMNMLLTRQISGLPVVDAAGRMTGMFTEKDILKAILPSDLSKTDEFTSENSMDVIRNKIARLADRQVKDLMRRYVISVDSQATVCELARLVMTQNVRRIPILEKGNKLVGIVSRTDLLLGLLKGSSQSHG